MGNYKDKGRLIEFLLKCDKPFLLIKYGVTICGCTNNVYEIVTRGTRTLQYSNIDRKAAIEAINKLKLPLLYKMDGRNMIWGDERFKDKFKKNRICEDLSFAED